MVIGGGGDPTKRGVVSTASYEARKFGIHSAMPLMTAHKLCPNAIFLSVDYEEYSRVFKNFKAVLGEFTPIIEDVGIDEAFLDISSIDRPSFRVSNLRKEERSPSTLKSGSGHLSFHALERL